MYLLQILLKGKNEDPTVQFIRYFLMGGTAFVVDFILLFIFTEYLHFHYLISNFISFWFGMFATYKVSVNWVFTNRNLKNKYAEFGIFALIGALSLLLNMFLMWLFTDIVGIYYLVSKIITAGFCYIWNFTTRKYFLFR